MSKTIAWVDEDDRIWAPERKLLIGLGYQVQVFSDASTALDTFQGEALKSYHLIVLDVMLLQGSNVNSFSDVDTNLGRDTGLVLAQHICRQSPETGKRILFLSRATEQSHIGAIEKVAKELGAVYLRKSNKTTRGHFIELLKKHGFIPSSG